MTKTALTSLAGFALAAAAPAQIRVDFVADGTGRFIDYFSNAYAQIDLEPDGMYDLTTDQPYGPTDNFPVEGDWSDAGTLLLSGPVTGVGTETFTIVGTTGFDFDRFVDGATSSILMDYTTTLSGVSGSVTLTDGVVTDLTYTSAVGFTFDVGGQFVTYDGTLSLTEGTFDLFVDDTETDFGVRQAWDFGGTTFATAEAVPEPATLLVLGAGALGLAARRRRS